MANCVFLHNICLEIIFSFLYQAFSFHLWPQAGCSFVSNQHLATSSLSFLQSACFDLPQQSASKADKGRGLPFHVLARLLVKSSRETLCNLSMQFKKTYYSKLPQRACSVEQKSSKKQFSGAALLSRQRKTLLRLPPQMLQGIKLARWS